MKPHTTGAAGDLRSSQERESPTWGSGVLRAKRQGS